MNLDKIDVLLCFAFQHGDGPFNVFVTMTSCSEHLSLYKQGIFTISDQEEIISISLSQRKEERRWRDRSYDR